MSSIYLLIFIIFLHLSLCKTNPDSVSRWPPYHELYTLNSRFIANEFLANSSCHSTDFTDPSSDILSNSTKTSSRNQFVSDLQNRILNIVLERTDLANLMLDGEISMECLADLYYLAESVQKKDAWALKVLDSMGKPPSGLETGNVIWAGDYDHCLEVAAPAINISVRVGPFRYHHPASYNGQYCMATIIKKGDPPPPVPAGYLLGGLTIGICVPGQCTDKMLTKMAKAVEKMFNKTMSKLGLHVGDVVCPRTKDHLDGPAILAVVVLAILLALATVGTIVELIVHFRRKGAGKILDDISIAADPASDPTVAVSDGAALIETDGGRRETFLRIITSFSLVTNTRRLFSTAPANRSTSLFSPLGPTTAASPATDLVDLPCLHGIRFLSMAWIILGHTYYFSFAMTANPLDRLDPNRHDFWFQAILQAAYACDTFFVISACLVTTQFFSIADRYPQLVGTCRFWITFYLQRFLRLTPPYMLILCVYIGLWKYVGNGPFWPSEGFEIDNCRRTWWSNLLYINNYLNIPYEQHDWSTGMVSGREYCAAWTWYLAVDMQFFWISPLILYPIFKARQSRRWSLLGYSMLTIFVFLGLLVTGIISRVNGLPPNMFPADLALRDKAQFMKDELFFKPYPHLPCYAVGILLALALRRYRQQGQVGMSKLKVIIGWSLSFSFSMAVIYGLWPNYRGRPFAVDLSAAYATCSRFVFATCVAWVAYACLIGYGGYVNTFLSWQLFKPLSRLSFVAYLIHPMLLFAYFFSRRTPFYYTEFVMVWFFGGFLLFSYLAAIGVALFFEFPFTTLNRRFVKRVE